MSNYVRVVNEGAAEEEKKTEETLNPRKRSSLKEEDLELVKDIVSMGFIRCKINYSILKYSKTQYLLTR